MFASGLNNSQSNPPASESTPAPQSVPSPTDNPGKSIESARLQALYRYQILDSLPEQAYNDIALLAASICKTPIALVSLIDEARQWFKAKIGIDVEETPRSLSFCTYAIQDPNQLMIVPDASRDERFADNQLVTDDPNIRFYAGAPLVTSEGLALGTLCVIDTVPRDLTEEQKHALAALSRQVMAQMELRYLNMINTRNVAEAQQAMMSSRMLAEQVQDLYNNAPCGYHSLNKDANFVLINDTELEWLGYERDELLGENIEKVLPPEERDNFTRNFEITKELGSREGLEIVLQRKDGTRFPASLNVSLIRDKNGEFLSTRSTMFDISQAKAATLALRESEARFQAFMNNGPIVATIKDAKGCYLYANSQMLERFNKSYEDFVGHYDFELWPADIYQQVREHDQLVLAGESAVALEQTVTLLDGEVTCWLSFKFPLHDACGRKLLGAIAIDITDRKYYEQQLQEYQLQLEEAIQRLEEIAITDALTQVKNHGAFMARLEEEVARAHRYQTPLSLLMLDADNFKQYNDTFGHPAGDAVLKKIAECLQECARPSDFVARYGGEEFAVILSNTDAEGAVAFAERMRSVIEDGPWSERGVTVSIGVAALDAKISDCVKLLAAADKALYAAKRAGKNRVSLAN